MHKRSIACLLALSLASCESLYGQFSGDNASNCVVNSALCPAPDQACNPVTRDCEPAIVLSAIEPPASSTLGGDTITLSGQRFSADLRVRIGDRDAGAVTLLSDRSLSVVVPASPDGRGPVTVELIHPAGQTQRRDGLFRYYENVQLAAPQPSILPFTPRYLRLSDINQDGRQDVVFSDGFSGAVAMLLAQSDGSFSPPLTTMFSSRAFALASGDVNGDSIPDLAVSLTGPTTTIEVAIGNGDGSFRTPVAVTTQSTVGAMGLGDFNGDGKADLVAADDLRLRIWHSNGDGSFATPSLDTTLAYQGFSALARLQIADLNNDKLLDIIAINTRDLNFPVFFGSGNSNFTEVTSQVSADVPNGFSLGDSDGDGLLDIVTTSGSTQHPVALTQQGSGRTFKVPILLPAPNSVSTSDLRDLNSDGVADIVVFHSLGTAGAFAILHGISAGRFAAPRTYTLPPFPVAILVAQFDSDPRPDVFLVYRGAGSSGNFYSVLKNVTP